MLLLVTVAWLIGYKCASRQCKGFDVAVSQTLSCILSPRLHNSVGLKSEVRFLFHEEIA